MFFVRRTGTGFCLLRKHGHDASVIKRSKIKKRDMKQDPYVLVCVDASFHFQQLVNALGGALLSPGFFTSQIRHRQKPDSIIGHIVFMSPAALPHIEKFNSIVRQIYGRSPTDDLNDLDVNNAFWVFFLNVTLQAAVHLGQDFLENLRFTKIQLLKSAKTLFLVRENYRSGHNRQQTAYVEIDDSIR